MTAITASEARRSLFPLIKQVNDEHEPVEIVSRHGNAVLMSKEDYDSWMTTMYLLNPHNAPHLLRAIAQAEGGDVEEHELIR